jgi:hypothetical protein
MIIYFSLSLLHFFPLLFLILGILCFGLVLVSRFTFTKKQTIVCHMVMKFGVWYLIRNSNSFDKKHIEVRILDYQACLFGWHYQIFCLLKIVGVTSLIKWFIMNHFISQIIYLKYTEYKSNNQLSMRCSSVVRAWL